MSEAVGGIFDVVGTRGGFLQNFNGKQIDFCAMMPRKFADYVSGHSMISSLGQF